MQTDLKSDFKKVFENEYWSKEFLKFLEIVYTIYPHERFHQLITRVTKEYDEDEKIYKQIQLNLASITPFLAALRYSLPSLKKQKMEITSQTLEILREKKHIKGYLEIGTTGRYISELRKNITIEGRIFLSNDIEPSFSIEDIFERGQISKIGEFFNLNDYAPIGQSVIPDESVDLVTCYIGLHHCHPKEFSSYVSSVNRILRSGGMFIVREHDVSTDEMAIFVSLVHTVFNLGLKVEWEKDSTEYKSFRTINEWCDMITQEGFKDLGFRILQKGDPTLNTLIGFIKE